MIWFTPHQGSGSLGGWVLGLGSAVACTCLYVKACELACAISRRVLIAHGLKRHPCGIVAGGVSDRVVWKMRVERCRVRVCATSRCSEPRGPNRPWCQETHTLLGSGNGIWTTTHMPLQKATNLGAHGWRCKGPRVCFPCKLCGQKWFVTDVVIPGISCIKIMD